MVPGLVGPKPRRICVGDGHQVNIPELVIVVRISQRMTGAVNWYLTVQQSRELERSERTYLRVCSILGEALARKDRELKLLPTVPQTNTGARVE